MTQTREQLEKQNGRFLTALLTEPPAGKVQEALDMANQANARLVGMVRARDAKLARLEAKLAKAERTVFDLNLRLCMPGETLSEIMRWVARKHRITMAELTGPRRFTDFVRARQEYYWQARQRTSKSFPQIGRACGDRDHSTVMYGIEQYQARLDAQAKVEK